MRKAIILIHLINLVTLAACSTAQLDTQSMQTVNAVPIENPLPETFLSLLPEDFTMPDHRPTRVNDSLLLAAWVFLYNQVEPVTIHNGRVLSGRSLAQSVIDNDIAITWGSEDICGGSSCARRYICSSQECIENYVSTEPKIVYITADLNRNTRKSFAYLVKTLAHELYHLTLPFGPVASSLYEEYWAFYIGTQISKAGWMEFDRYDPHKAACLERWFVVYGLGAYDELEVYPTNLNIAVDTASTICMP
jgi:hypothetical protein